MDPREDPEAWADALLEQHRTAKRGDPDPAREAAAHASQASPPIRELTDYRQDPLAWADAVLDAHRTGGSVDPERRRAAAAEALQQLPRHVRWMLTHGGNEPDPDVVLRLARGSRFKASMRRWDTILNFVSLLAVCALGLLLLSFL